MFQPSALLLAAIALFIPSALAGEGVHLANCGPNVGSPITSVIAYYPDDSKSNTAPLSQNIAFATNPERVVTWEGNSYTASFATGNTFTTHIQSGSFSFGQYAGTGNNQQRQFVCFRDNNRQLWRASDAYACFSIYYCLDA
ncbi:uncharacterized protein TRIVIDRAFT_34247 [Trichoderma virens Gv29-8]|uniref:SSCRP protein n=1 Tax=Hypocrea virens (strain Gv29-8 / FGSC 10586) TaxID=413071 RepID=G9MEI8_HYPVG|nr:uncharacterized protein TRIVIDRAFT_34247 [Trichoderma virens Gv29-8]EHK27505.1 hypothetical protein TRIVIDRAFT_34247 [Trichoderma virens Gv29-8]UKZ57925.1 hypothetical protein TrVGV298_011786 [Trichoderma virens]